MSQSLYFINHNNKEFTLDKFLKKLENLAYTTAWAIMFELEVRLFADTTQSRLRREGKDIKPFLQELLDDLAPDEYIKIKDWVKTNGKKIGLDQITTSEIYNGPMGRHSHQFITDGWSRLTMLISFLLGCILFHRDKFNNNDSVLEELISLFYVDDKFKFKFMNDVSKVSEKDQVNFNIELLVNGDYDINKIKTYAKQKSCFQMNLFSRQVLECYKWLGKRKIKSPMDLQNLYNNVLHGCLFDTKHVPKGVDREKSFFNKNIRAKNLTPECEDSTLLFNERDKYGLPYDTRIATLIDDYFQELVYYIKEFEEVEVKNWYGYIVRSLVSRGNFNHRTKEKARKRLRKDVGEALKGVYIVNNRELSDKTIKQMKAALLNLDYTVDFKNMSELRKMDYKSNVWPICLSLMRDDNFTNEMKSFTYFLFKISDLCGDELWTKGNDDWFYPLLKDNDLSTKPFDTIHKHLITDTFIEKGKKLNIKGHKYDIRDSFATRQVYAKITDSLRRPLAITDWAVGLFMAKQYPELSQGLMNFMNGGMNEVSSVEHIHSQEPESDSTKQCVEMGGNVVYAGKWDNTRYGNLDYGDKREKYQSMMSTISPTLRLFQFGTEGVTIDSDLKPTIDGLFDDDRSSLTLDDWDAEVRADQVDNKLYKFYRYMIGKMLDLKTLKSMVKDYSKKK